MNTKSKIAITSLISGTALFFILRNYFPINATQPLEHSIQWAKFNVYFIIGMVVLDVLGVVIVNAFTEKGFDEVVDERDHHIERIVMRRFAILFSAGFLIALVTLAFKHDLFMFFSILTWTIFINRIVLWMSYILAYEKGI